MCSLLPLPSSRSSPFPFSPLGLQETRLWAGAGPVFSLFDNGREIDSFLAPDTIHDLVATRVTRESELDAVLACADRTVRVVQGGRAVLDLTLDEHHGSGASGSGTGAVTVIQQYPLTDAPGSRTGAGGVDVGRSASLGAAAAAAGLPGPHALGQRQHLLFGTATGHVGHLVAATDSLRQGWRTHNAGRLRGGGITALTAMDATGDGAADVVIGRDDGRLQVISFDGSSSSEPSLVFSTDAGESIRSLEAGMVRAPKEEKQISSLCVLLFLWIPSFVSCDDSMFPAGFFSGPRGGRVCDI